MALQKAEKYNMLADREVNGLMSLMYYLGCDFDEDPMFPWARFKRFPDKNYHEDDPESFVHLQKVYSRFYRFFNDAHGENYKHAKAALERVRAVKFQDLLALQTDAQILNAVMDFYPQRYVLLPQDALRRQIMQAAQKKSIEYDLEPQVGKVLFMALIFCCGVSVDIDPLFINLKRSLEKGPVGGMRKEQTILNHLKVLAATNVKNIEESTLAGESHE